MDKRYFRDIIITDSQMVEIEIMALKRTEGNRDANIEERWASKKHTSSEIELSGMRAEAAWCLYIGRPISDCDTYSPGGDDGYDFIYKGFTIDVKMTSSRRGSNNLLRPTKYPDDYLADYYVLFWPLGKRSVTIVGGISGKRLLEEIATGDLKLIEEGTRNEAWVLPWQKLSPVGKLPKIL